MIPGIPAIKTLGHYAGTIFSVLLLTLGTSQAEPQQETTAGPGDTLGTKLALSSTFQGNSGLDRGGEVSILRNLVTFGLEKRLGPSLKSDFSFTYRHSRFHFDQPAAFDGNAPWETIHEAGFGALFDWQIEKTWSLMTLTSVEFSGEEGAVLKDTASVSLGVALSKQFNRTLSIGVGFAASSGLEEEKVIPMLVLFWQVSENWRLSNPFRPGPTSPAGLELSRNFDKRIELALGTSYRSQRFRLGERAAAANGIGESSDFLSYLRFSGNISGVTSIDLYTGLLWDGELTLENEDGQELYEVGYDPAPMLALTLKHRF